jgi:MFS family permease
MTPNRPGGPYSEHPLLPNRPFRLDATTRQIPVKELSMDAEVDTTRIIRKVAIAAMIATTIEWYDFFIYGTAAALAFPAVFFSSQLTPLMAQLVTFGTFAVGFAVRPIGAIVFGHYGDHVGRKKSLVTALVMMAAATTLMGLLPSYHSIGLLAPLMLVGLRCIQGFALGGQWGGATLLIAETAPKHRRGFYGSFGQAGAGTGTILANLVFLLASAALSQKDFIAWGWRVPFVLSIVLIPIALYIHLRIEDTPSFRRLGELKQEIAAKSHAKASAEFLEKRPSSPVLRVFRKFPRQLALAAGTIVGIQVTTYIMNVFAVAYATNPAGLNISRNVLLGGVLVGALTMIIGVFVGGAASDRYGRRRMIMIGGGLLVLWAFAFFPLVETRSALSIMVAIGVGMLFIGFVNGPQAAFFAELFSTDVRYSGVSLAYQGGAIFGGGIAPMIATALFSHFGTTFAVSIYVACCCLITVTSAFLSEESRGRDLDSPGRGRAPAEF